MRSAAAKERGGASSLGHDRPLAQTHLRVDGTIGPMHTPAGGLPQTVSALIPRGAGILMVAEGAVGDTNVTWMLPGGRVEAGESLETALAREIREETGLMVTGTPVLAFSVEIVAEMDDLVGAWRAVTFACRAEGEVAPADPDGLILEAEWVPIEDAITRLEAVEWYDSGPLRAFLAGEVPTGSAFRYRISGRRGATERSVVEVIGPPDADR